MEIFEKLAATHDIRFDKSNEDRNRWDTIISYNWVSLNHDYRIRAPHAESWEFYNNQTSFKNICKRILDR